jgi:hypothetical protein
MIPKAKTPLGGEQGFLTGEAGWGIAALQSLDAQAMERFKQKRKYFARRRLGNFRIGFFGNLDVEISRIPQLFGLFDRSFLSVPS